MKYFGPQSELEGFFKYLFALIILLGFLNGDTIRRTSLRALRLEAKATILCVIDGPYCHHRTSSTQSQPVWCGYGMRQNIFFLGLAIPSGCEHKFVTCVG